MNPLLQALDGLVVAFFDLGVDGLEVRGGRLGEAREGHRGRAHGGSFEKCASVHGGAG